MKEQFRHQNRLECAEGNYVEGNGWIENEEQEKSHHFNIQDLAWLVGPYLDLSTEPFSVHCRKCLKLY